MTTIYRRITGFCLALALVGGSGCDDFFDVNESPNSLTAVPSSTLLPPIITQLGFYAYGNFSLYTGSIMQYYAGHRGQPLQYAQLDLRPSDTDNSWSAMYADVLQDATFLQEQALASEQPAYAGIAQVLKANTYMLLTDIYGDIPFTQANNIAEFINTEYDDQQVVYEGIIAMLDEALVNLQADDAAYIGTEDILYQGDMDRWVKFANTLKLRALNHMSNCRPEAALQFLNTNPALMESNEDNALVPFFDAATQYNPRYYFDNISGRQDAAVSSTFVGLMEGLADPRFEAFFEPITNGELAGTIAGNVPGDNVDDSGRERFSRVGPSVAAADAPVVLASYAETQFLIAEIRHRAGEAGPAEEAYMEAVTASITYHVPDADQATIDAYLGQATVDYNGTLDRIMEQKYIEMYTMPYEAWVDYRRVDGAYPDLVTPINNKTSGQIPVRLPHPQVEIDLNGANLAAGPGIPVPNVTLVNDPVWWDNCN